MGDNCVLSQLMTDSTSWSLASDDALLRVLQDVSQNILSRSAQLLDKMDKLALRAASVQTQLDTAHNKFLGLSNVKFIEARVYDDAEDSAASEDTDQPGGGGGDTTMTEEEIVTEALKQGIDLVTTAFDKVQIQDSESESEDETEKQYYVLQPINKYHLRQLPAIIGSSEWFDDDNIGLADEDKVVERIDDVNSESESEDEEDAAEKTSPAAQDSDYSDDSEPDRGQESALHVPIVPAQSVSVRNDKDEQVESDSDFSDDDDDELFKPKKPVDQKRDGGANDGMEIKGDSVDSEYRDTTADAGVTSAPPAAGQATFAAELSRKLGLAPAPNPAPIGDATPGERSDGSQDNRGMEVSNEKVISKPVKKSALFDSSDEDEDDLFSGNSIMPKKAVKKPAVLPADPVTVVPKSEIKKKTETENNPTKDARMDEIHTDPPAKLAENLAPTLTIPQPKKSVFGNSSDDDEDEDIFADIQVVKTKPIENADIKKKPLSMFSLSDDSDSDDIFADLGGKLKTQTETNSAVKDAPGSEIFDAGNVKNINSDDASEKANVFSKAPVGGVSMFGGLNPSSLLKSQNKEELTKSVDVSESESDDDMFVDIATKSQNEKSRVDSGGDIKDTTHQSVDEKANDSAVINGPSSNPINVDSSDLSALEKAVEKPPAGGVSMFGKGFNITSLLKKNKSPSGEDDTDAGDNKEANDGEDKIDTRLITEKEVLQINISEPADVPKPGLMTVTKSRPKMSARRPPSRAGRKKLEEISVFDDLSSDNIQKQTSETVPDGFETSPSSPLSTSTRSAGIKPPVGGISMFGGFNPTDVLKKKRESIDDGSSINSTPADFTDPPPIVPVQPAETDVETEQSLVGPPPMEDTPPVKTSVDIFADSDSEDDLFGDLISKTSQKPTSSIISNNNLFGLDDEDDNDDDDDIFSSLMNKK